MKTIAFGPIHADLPALRACFAQAEKEGFDRIVHVGGVAGDGPDPEGCVRFLYDRNIRGVRGPVDEAAAQAADGAGRGMTLYARRLLADLPFELRKRTGGRILAVYHGSPVDAGQPLMETTPEPRLLEAGQASGADILVVGGGDAFWHRQAGGRHFVGPGPLPGRPGSGMAGYAVIESDAQVHVAFRQVPYRP
ncbi:MAG TPA: metallophosphoesterase family protein [Candidatus Polarisedimenticolia bacterium]|nr:metallophosphoesterase family protein [Candidatus Polarisedimenticolia bacterium]